MIDMLREIILDFQELDWPMGIPRRVHVAPMPGKATVCIGVRRSGKSTFMFQIMQRLMESGASRIRLCAIRGWNGLIFWFKPHNSAIYTEVGIISPYWNDLAIPLFGPRWWPYQ